MRRFQIPLSRVMLVIVPIVAALAMLARAVTAWGPNNLIVLAAFVLIAGGFLACLPMVPNRPFWAGLAGFGLAYAMIVTYGSVFAGNSALLPLDSLFHRLGTAQYGEPSPPRDFLDADAIARRKIRIASFLIACHAVTALAFGLLGGTLVLLLAKAREARRWDREALPELPLEDFLLPPLKVDRPLNSK